MILKYGMDPDLGTLIYYDSAKAEYTPFKPYSEKTSELIDKKVKELT
jgi:cell division protease FtsH